MKAPHLQTLLTSPSLKQKEHSGKNIFVLYLLLSIAEDLIIWTEFYTNLAKVALCMQLGKGGTRNEGKASEQFMIFQELIDLKNSLFL